MTTACAVDTQELPEPPEPPEAVAVVEPVPAVAAGVAAELLPELELEPHPATTHASTARAAMAHRTLLKTPSKLGCSFLGSTTRTEAVRLITTRTENELGKD